MPGDEERELILPPTGGRDICSICRGVDYDHGSYCENCRENASSLQTPCIPLTVISLYERPSRLRDWLTFYKSTDESLADQAAVSAISSIFSNFFNANETWLRKLGIDYSVVVPSTIRPAPHPLAMVLGDQRPQMSFESVLRRTTEPLGHNAPHAAAFVADGSHEGERVLLVDDVYTSGARAQSAAFALSAAGAEVKALCVLGRRYNPTYSETAAGVLAAQRRTPFMWSLAERDQANIAFRTA